MSTPKTLKIVITEAVNIGGERHTPGEEEPNVIELELHEARRIVNSRKAEFYQDDEPETGKNIVEAPTDPAERKAAIMEAIEKLDPEEDFTKGGKPRVKPVVEYLGFDVTGKEVTEAWDSMEETE